MKTGITELKEEMPCWVCWNLNALTYALSYTIKGLFYAVLQLARLICAEIS